MSSTRRSSTRATSEEVVDVAITRWDPFRDLLNLQNEMTRLFGRVFGEDVEGSRVAWAPPIDIYETPEAYRVVAELPGFSPEEVDVTVSDGMLTIRGERKFYENLREEDFHRIERRFGPFQRLVTLPAQVDADRVEASFDKGLLTVTIPKAEHAKPRRIAVKATS
jgi:HSP20 family protein